MHLVAAMPYPPDLLGVAFTIYRAAHDRQVRRLREQSRQKEHEILVLKREGNGQFKIVNERLEKELDEARGTARKQMDAARTALRKLRADHGAAAGRWKAEDAGWRGKCDRLQETVGSLTTKFEAARDDLTSHDQADRASADLLRRAMKLEGSCGSASAIRGFSCARHFIRSG
jgi:hypothetical protein